MKYITWMIAFGIVLVSVGNIPQDNTYIYHVAYFELNHRYNINANLTFDQMILWDWADYYYVEDSWNKHRLEGKVVDWYMVTKYRKKLTDKEYKKKNIEFVNDWIKKFGRNPNQVIPKYTPPFQGGIEIPRYDYDRECWKVVLLRGNVIIIVYAKSYCESWTQIDPEIENRKLFDTNTRRNIFIRLQ